MNKLRALIRTIFGFSRTETNAFIILLPLMLIIIASEPVYEAWYTSGIPDYSKDEKLIDSLVATWEWPEEKDSAAVGPVTLFAFDPNTATEKDLLGLGLDRRLVQRMINYRSKGGKFRVRSDLKKMYGLDSSTYVRLERFVKLPEKSAAKKDGPTRWQAQRRPASVFDLNTADSTLFNSIQGIGPILASRIIRYRDKLGGFIVHDQIYEVWGLDSVVVSRLVIRSTIGKDFVPVRLPINAASEAQLSDHPYLRGKLAKAIVVYRFQHGPFTAIDDLRKISIMDEKAFLRIKPYLILE